MGRQKGKEKIVYSQMSSCAKIEARREEEE
jgi:hypothetical protein